MSFVFRTDIERQKVTIENMETPTKQLSHVTPTQSVYQMEDTDFSVGHNLGEREFDEMMAFIPDLRAEKWILDPATIMPTVTRGQLPIQLTKDGLLL